MSYMESLDFAKEVLRHVWAEFVDHFDAAAIVDRLYSRKLIDDSTMDVILTAKHMKDANRAFLLHLRSNATIESLEKLCKLLHDTGRDHQRHDRLATLLEGELKQWKGSPSSHVAAQRGDKGESPPSFRTGMSGDKNLVISKGNSATVYYTRSGIPGALPQTREDGHSNDSSGSGSLPSQQNRRKRPSPFSVPATDSSDHRSTSHAHRPPDHSRRPPEPLREDPSHQGGEVMADRSHRTFDYGLNTSDHAHRTSDRASLWFDATHMHRSGDARSSPLSTGREVKVETRYKIQAHTIPVGGGDSVATTTAAPAGRSGHRHDPGSSHPDLEEAHGVITLTEELLPFLDHFLPHLLLLGVVLGIDNLVAILNGRGSAKEKCLNILEMWLRRTASPTWELFCSLLQRHATFIHVRSLIMEARAHDFKSESEDDGRSGPDDNVDQEFRKVIHGMSHATNVKTVIQSLRSYLTETLPIDADLLTTLHGTKLIAAGNIKSWKSLLFHGKENEVRCELVDYIEGFYTPEYLAMFTDLLLKQSKKSKPILKDIAEKLRVEMGKGNIELLRSDELWEQLIITYEQNGNTCKEHEFPTGFVKKRIESSKSTKVSSSYFFKQSAESDPVEVEFGPPVTIPWGKDLPEKVLGKEKLDLARMRPAWSGALKELPQAARKLASDQEQKPAEEA